MRLTLSSYSLAGLLRDGRASTLTDLPRFASDLGFSGFEVVASSDDALKLAEPLKQACSASSLTVTTVCVGSDFLANDVATQANALRKAVDACAILGAPVLRHDATQGWPRDSRSIRNFTRALPRLAEGYRAVTEYAAGLGVKTTVENHGFFCQDSDRIEALIDAVDHPNFGALVDIGNFLCADEDPVHAVSRLAPLAAHVHAKDFHVKRGGANPGLGWFRTRGGNWLRGAIAGHGELDIPRLLGILKRAGYDGWVTVEFEGIEDCLLGAGESRKNLESMIDALD
ncbi:MAG: sugar phosphate isomerase/epimerase [Oscillospiraceae bacterium]|jgi:sugar phosphate isomerase/epimerase|nr:sugar phosphate isomerase/epimerase [Oscillospiraceae bacterium]